jgi:hypothetical protein
MKRILTIALSITATAALGFAQATLTQATLDSTLQTRYAANLAVADAEVIMTNTGADGAGAALAPLSVGSASNVTGAICVNVYTLDPGEELESCCSCPVTPDGLVSLLVKANLLLNPLFPGPAPSSVVIKLYATVPAAGPTGCAGQAANTLAVAAPGLAAWGTTTHVIPGNNVALVATETAFTPSTVSASEILKLQQTCEIAVNGAASGAGICSGCVAGGGALGGSSSK